MPNRIRASRPWAPRAILGGLLCGVVALVGCVEMFPAGTDGGTAGAGGAVVDSGENGKFDTAQKVTLPDDGPAEITGRITRSSDVDVFRLESLAAGDQVTIDVQAADRGLDLVVALFDADESIHAFNDDRVSDGSNLNPLISVVIRGAAGDYFLGIAPYPVSGGTGDYSVRISVQRGVGVPQAEPQVVYFDWRGGNDVTIRNVGTFDLPVLDAATLGSSFAGQTQVLKDQVLNFVAERYAAFNVAFISSDTALPPAGEHTTIFFGGQSDRAFAISEQIDSLNIDQSDNAIVFTDSFRGAFSTIPTIAQMATAIGNTTAHEIGHLLGLVHTKSCTELMDTTCGNDSILIAQVFGTAPLDASVFPIGVQDAVELIGWAVGFATP